MNQQQTEQKTPIVLSVDEQAAFEKGLQSEATGIDYTMEECFEIARKLRKEWIKAPVKIPA